MTNETTRLTHSDYFDVALRILRAGSHEDLTIGILCDDLNVSKGSFYHHFGSWGGFIDAFLEFWEYESTNKVKEMADKLDSAKEQRRLFASFMKTFPREVESALRVWSRTNPKVKATQRRIDEGRFTMLSAALEPQIGRKEAELVAMLSQAVFVSGQLIDDPTVAMDTRRLMSFINELLAARFGEAAFG
jgi:AcrR family transcriptional regulator